MDYLLILISLLFTTGGQLLQKLAANKAAALPGEVHYLKRIFTQVETWWAIAALGVGTVLWLGVLFRMEVSRAFPFLSLGFVLVMLVSRYRLGEVISLTRWSGVAFIVTGIFLVSLA